MHKFPALAALMKSWTILRLMIILLLPVISDIITMDMGDFNADFDFILSHHIYS